MQDSQNVAVRLDLGNKQEIRVEAEAPVGYQDVSISNVSMDTLLEEVRLFAAKLRSALQEAAPTKATAEFGVSFSVESGKLAAVIAKGTGTANITITLEWSHDKH